MPPLLAAADAELLRGSADPPSPSSPSSPPEQATSAAAATVSTASRRSVVPMPAHGRAHGRAAHRPAGTDATPIVLRAGRLSARLGR